MTKYISGTDIDHVPVNLRAKISTGTKLIFRTFYLQMWIITAHWKSLHSVIFAALN